MLNIFCVHLYAYDTEHILIELFLNNAFYNDYHLVLKWILAILEKIISLYGWKLWDLSFISE